MRLKSDVILTLVMDMVFAKMTLMDNHLHVPAAISGQDMHVIYGTFVYQILAYIMEHVQMGILRLYVRASLDILDKNVR